MERTSEANLRPPVQSYLIRWVDCPVGNTIHWSVKPHKKSLYVFTPPLAPASCSMEVRLMFSEELWVVPSSGTFAAPAVHRAVHRVHRQHHQGD